MAEHSIEPTDGGPDTRFQNGLREGRILLQRSRAVGQCFFYPRVGAPGTGQTDLEWVEASGDGTVYSTTVVRRKPDHGGDYNLALVTLDEGPRLLTRVTDVEPHHVSIGQRVTGYVGQIENQAVVLFRLAGGAS